MFQMFFGNEFVKGHLIVYYIVFTQYIVKILLCYFEHNHSFNCLTNNLNTQKLCQY
jgi:hypothetical protein